MRPEKQLLLDEIKEMMNQANGLIVMGYSKLSPKVSWDLNKNLSEKNSYFEVVKKRIFIKAAEELGLDIALKDIKNHVGIVFAREDAFEATKSIMNFNKKNDNFLEVIAGKIEGKLYSSKDMETISKLPTQDQMRAQLLGLFEAPMTSTLSTMESLITSVIYCIENKRKLAR
jgi:large subunit ribosomal protein L10